MKIINNIKQHPIHFFFKIVLPIIVVLFIVYKSGEWYIISKKLSKEKSVISTYNLNENISKSDLTTIKNSWYIEGEQNWSGALFVLPLEKYNETDTAIKEFISNGSEYSCIKYNSWTFSQSESAKKLLMNNFYDVLNLVWTGAFYEVNKNELWLWTGNIVIARSTQSKVLNSLEYEKYFSWAIDPSKLPLYVLTQSPYPAWKWKIFWYNFDNYSYSAVKITKMVTLDKNKTYVDNANKRLIFVATKFKKQWNGLIIDEYNRKALKELEQLMNNENISVNDISVENENLTIKKQTYNSDGYYLSIDDYLNKIKNWFTKNNIQYSIEKYKNWIIINTNSEYLWVIFDTNWKLESEYGDIKDKLSLGAESYQVEETFYFIDKNLFKIDSITKDTNTDNCDAILKNALIIK